MHLSTCLVFHLSVFLSLYLFLFFYLPFSCRPHLPCTWLYLLPVLTYPSVYTSFHLPTWFSFYLALSASVHLLVLPPAFFLNNLLSFINFPTSPSLHLSYLPIYLTVNVIPLPGFPVTCLSFIPTWTISPLFFYLSLICLPRIPCNFLYDSSLLIYFSLRHFISLPDYPFTYLTYFPFLHLLTFPTLQMSILFYLTARNHPFPHTSNCLPVPSSHLAILFYASLPIYLTPYP